MGVVDHSGWTLSHQAYWLQRVTGAERHSHEPQAPQRWEAHLAAILQVTPSGSQSKHVGEAKR